MRILDTRGLKILVACIRLVLVLLVEGREVVSRPGLYSLTCRLMEDAGCIKVAEKAEMTDSAGRF